MGNYRIWACIGVLLLAASGSIWGQEAASSSAVPMLTNFSGTLADASGKPVTAATSVTFYLYQNQQGGAPLWSETQRVQPNDSGSYTVELGSATGGLPASLFVMSEPRWLEVEAQGLPIPPRVMLLSVPYALKAGDAQTIGGLPPSAFVLAAPNAPSTSTSGVQATSAPSGIAPASSNVTTTGGTVNALPLWTTATNIQSSVVTQTGTGSTAKIGINTITPATTLDVKGSSTVRGTLSLPATAVATSTRGASSQPVTLGASTYNSTTATAVPQTFQLQAEPVGNDTSSASGSLNLLYASGTNKAAETGLHIGSNGQITFAAGQTFPGTGTGNGTITGVTAGTALTGGGTSGGVTLNVDTTKVPLLAASNTFTGNQTTNGNLTATGVISGSGFQIGSDLFAFGSIDTLNTFEGFSGNTTMTGQSNTGSGGGALIANTSGGLNSAFGAAALNSNTSGSGNTAVGEYSLRMNTTGGANTAVGQSAGQPSDVSFVTGIEDTFLGIGTAIGTGSLNNATAIGAEAEVDESNAMVLGSIKNVNGATASTSVGIGTTTPGATLDVQAPSGATPTINFGSASNAAALTVNGTGKFTGLVTFASSQTFPGAVTAVTAGSGLAGGGTGGNLSLSVSNAGINNSMLQNPSLTISPGTAMTGGGSVALGGSTTLNLDTTKVPLLAANNTFTGVQTINGPLTSTGVINAGTVFDIADTQVLSILPGLFNLYVGQSTGLGAGSNNTGQSNTAVGYQAFYLNTSGSSNAAFGTQTLYNNTTGNANTAVGDFALFKNTTGINNTALGSNTGSPVDGTSLSGASNIFIGYGAAPSTGTLNNAGAIGTLAEVTQSNSIVIGGIAGVNGATVSQNVGIGTTAPISTLEVDSNVKGPTVGPTITMTNTAGSGQISLDFNTYPPSSTGIYNPASRMQIGDQGNYSDSIVFLANVPGAPNHGLTSTMSIDPYGDVHVYGTLSKGAGSFKIDHPLDPENKYLSHSFVESPDMMNIYNGIITLDEHGSAWITMPDYFEALNRDFRYQLTSVGRPQPTLFIAHEILKNRFRISGGKPRGRVSWQVTGIRHDAYADAHRIPTEQEKTGQERGKYLHPELFGAPQEAAIGARPVPTTAGR